MGRSNPYLGAGRSASASVAATARAWSRPAAKAVKARPFAPAAARDRPSRAVRPPGRGGFRIGAATRKRRATAATSGRGFAIVNLQRLAHWDPAVEITPDSLQERGLVKAVRDGVKILGSLGDAALPAGLRVRYVLFSKSARETLLAAGAQLEDELRARTH